MGNTVCRGGEKKKREKNAPTLALDSSIGIIKPAAIHFAEAGSSMAYSSMQGAQICYERSKASSTRVRLTKCLSSARACQVWRAEMEGNGECVAKIFNIPVCEKRQIIFKDFSGSFLDLALKEARITKSIDSTHCVRLHELLQTDKHLILLMDYAQNGPVLGRDSKLNYDKLEYKEAKQVFRALCKALIYLHCMDIVHMDVKPENFLSFSDGTYKLSDFGSALHLKTDSKFTHSFGTPSFMPPELLKTEGVIVMEDRELLKKADVWSAGVSLFVFIYGELPFNGERMRDVQVSISRNRRFKDGRFSLSGRPDYGLEERNQALEDMLGGMFRENPRERLSMEEVWNHRWTQDLP